MTLRGKNRFSVIKKNIHVARRSSFLTSNIRLLQSLYIPLNHSSSPPFTLKENQKPLLILVILFLSLQKNKKLSLSFTISLTFLLFCLFPIPSHHITFRLYGFLTSLRVPGVFNINIFTPTKSLNFIYI